MSLYLNNYVTFLKSRIDLKKPLTVVADPSNGTAGLIMEKLIDIPNLKLILINNTPDGNFPAHGPNPLEKGATGQLGTEIIKHKADFGVAFDADGDRAFFVDNKGTLLPSHESAILLFKNNKPPFVSDELVYQALKHLNLYTDADLKPSRVGSRFVKELLKEVKASAGAEFSGHYYFDTFFGLDSGIFAFIEVARAVSAMNISISDYFASIVPHILINESVKIEGKDVAVILKKIESHYQDKAIIGRRDGITLDFGSLWINIRPSNTEPIIRLIGGAPQEADIRNIATEIQSLI